MKNPEPIPDVAEGELNARMILDSMPDPVLVIDSATSVEYANMAAQQCLAVGLTRMKGRPVASLFAEDSPVVSLLQEVAETNIATFERDVEFELPMLGTRLMDVQVMPVLEDPGSLLLVLQDRGVPQSINRQLTTRGAARSVSGMASVLAHEIKNPLSGIRGAAQLLESSANEADQRLTRLICDEADRIVRLLDRMEVFSDDRPLDREPVNIHEILNHAREVGRHGYAKSVKFHDVFDPSLPPVLGAHDQLVQVFLNLIRNAIEALPEEGGEITLTTAFRHGMHIALPGTRGRVTLPLEVCVIDNGSGVPEELRPHIFDPFITTKASGTGLGLALVAKIIADHGGTIECLDVQKKGTTAGTMMRILLPIDEQKGTP